MIFVSHVVSSDAMNGSSFITLQEPYFLYSILTATCFTGQDGVQVRAKSLPESRCQLSTSAATESKI
jgi:hypothetical protein